MNEKKRWRKLHDAHRVENLDALHRLLPYIMPKRTEAEVFIKEKMDVTELMRYIRETNAEKGTNLKLFHAILTAVAKTVYLRPNLNRFISGRRYWQRDDITLSFVAKKKFQDNGEESLMVLKCEEDHTIFDISKIVLGDVERVRETQGEDDDFEKTMDFVASMPRPIMTFFFFILKRLEYHGRMPKFLTYGDSNYASVLLSNLGSIECEAPYHHLNNYGTNSVMITIGVMHKEEVFNAQGEKEVRDFVNVGITLDERIGDGFYFARCVKLVRHILSHPQLLEQPIKEHIAYEG